MGAVFGDMKEYFGSDDINTSTATKSKIKLKEICNLIISGEIRNIITMAGAGISTACGIPDFRSPGTGLYENLSKYNLPSPQAIFDLHYFSQNPNAFFMLAKELFFSKKNGINSFQPSTTHFFIRLLQEKGLLLRHYTQNVDGLESVAGITDDKMVEAHGHFRSAHCIECHAEYGSEFIRNALYSNMNTNTNTNDEEHKETVSEDNIPRCLKCKALVKPDIVFFGESLPKKFHSLSAIDFQTCDLLIILGTSLKVHPFAGLVSKVSNDCIRLYLNNVQSGGRYLLDINGEEESKRRDLFVQGTCDESVLQMCQMLGWTTDLHALIPSPKNKNINKNQNSTSSSLMNVVGNKLKKLRLNVTTEDKYDGDESKD